MAGSGAAGLGTSACCSQRHRRAPAGMLAHALSEMPASPARNVPWGHTVHKACSAATVGSVMSLLNWYVPAGLHQGGGGGQGWSNVEHACVWASAGLGSWVLPPHGPTSSPGSALHVASVVIERDHADGAGGAAGRAGLGRVRASAAREALCSRASELGVEAASTRAGSAARVAECVVGRRDELQRWGAEVPTVTLLPHPLPLTPLTSRCRR